MDDEDINSPSEGATLPLFQGIFRLDFTAALMWICLFMLRVENWIYKTKNSHDPEIYLIFSKPNALQETPRHVPHCNLRVRSDRDVLQISCAANPHHMTACELGFVAKIFLAEKQTCFGFSNPKYAHSVHEMLLSFNADFASSVYFFFISADCGFYCWFAAEKFFSVWPHPCVLGFIGIIIIFHICPFGVYLTSLKFSTTPPIS